MSATELSRLVRTRSLPAAAMEIVADEGERVALAERFGLSAISLFSAEITLEAKGSVILATGTLTASIEQPCAVSGEDFTVAIHEPVDLRFVRESTLKATEIGDGEIEIDLAADDSDEIEYSGDAIDLGEALAQTLGLAIDPYAEGPGADEARQKAGITGDHAPSGPLAEALKALKGE